MRRKPSLGAIDRSAPPMHPYSRHKRLSVSLYSLTQCLTKPMILRLQLSGAWLRKSMSFEGHCGMLGGMWTF